MVSQMNDAIRILGLAFRDIWQEFWTILVVHVLFLIANLLIIPGPPAILALFFYGNRIAHGELASERDFLEAMRRYWKPAWRWGLLNIVVIGLLTGDHYLIGTLIDTSGTAFFAQSFYRMLLVVWILLQLFALPFLFEQEQPLVSQALQNAAKFVRKNSLFTVVLALLLGLSLLAGTLTFMLTFAVGGALIAFASNRAVLRDLTGR